MEGITFEQLPGKVAEIDEKIDQLLHLMSIKPVEEETERWLTMEELCQYLGSDSQPLSRNTVYGWVQTDRIPYKKKGKRLYFSKKEIDLWMKDAA